MGRTEFTGGEVLMFCWRSCTLQYLLENWGTAIGDWTSARWKIHVSVTAIPYLYFN